MVTKPRSLLTPLLGEMTGLRAGSCSSSVCSACLQRHPPEAGLSLWQGQEAGSRRQASWEGTGGFVLSASGQVGNFRGEPQACVGPGISVVAHLSLQMDCAIVLLEKNYLYTIQPTPRSPHGTKRKKKSIENFVYEWGLSALTFISAFLRLNCK